MPPAAIIPLAVGENDLNWRAWRLLFEAGVYTNAAFPPGVPPGQALLRLSMMASMTEESIAYAADAIVRTFDILGLRSC
jgi:8-amino-7-oxononanoate synthase